MCVEFSHIHFNNLVLNNGQMWFVNNEFYNVFQDILLVNQREFEKSV